VWLWLISILAPYPPRGDRDRQGDHQKPRHMMRADIDRIEVKR